MKFAYIRKQSVRLGLLLVVITAAVFVGTAILTMAKSTAAVRITVRNNSQREIHHIYLAVNSPDAWSADQLHNGTVTSGASFVLEGVTCGGPSVRVIAEDQNGCFVYFDAACDADQTWEITDAASPDCGG